MQRLQALVDWVQDQVAAAATGPFGHAPFPLDHTLDYDGDSGLCGPDSATWPVIGDVASFLGGLRALLVQSAHPEVVAGVADHSTYRQDPLGRLSRTSAYVTATAFGAGPEVERAIEIVENAHRRVSGTSHRGRPYSADTPELAAWVHNALTESFLVAYRRFGPDRLSESDADRFVREQACVGRLLGADPLPETARELSRWIAEHPDVGPSPGAQQTIAFLRTPPLSRGARLGYLAMLNAAAATIPPRVCRALDLRALPGARLQGNAIIGFMRWAMGSSPAWHLALLRCHAPVPPGRFRRTHPAAAAAQVG
jgi:uncharacterized protein (DUF2236 family)